MISLNMLTCSWIRYEDFFGGKNTGKKKKSENISRSHDMEMDDEPNEPNDNQVTQALHISCFFLYINTPCMCGISGMTRTPFLYFPYLLFFIEKAKPFYTWKGGRETPVRDRGNGESQLGTEIMDNAGRGNFFFIASEPCLLLVCCEIFFLWC